MGLKPAKECVNQPFLSAQVGSAICKRLALSHPHCPAWPRTIVSTYYASRQYRWKSELTSASSDMCRLATATMSGLISSGSDRAREHAHRCRSRVDACSGNRLGAAHRDWRNVGCIKGGFTVAARCSIEQNREPALQSSSRFFTTRPFGNNCAATFLIS